MEANLGTGPVPPLAPGAPTPPSNLSRVVTALDVNEPVEITLEGK